MWNCQLKVWFLTENLFLFYSKNFFGVCFSNSSIDQLIEMAHHHIMAEAKLQYEVVLVCAFIHLCICRNILNHHSQRIGHKLCALPSSRRALTST